MSGFPQTPQFMSLVRQQYGAKYHAARLGNLFRGGNQTPVATAMSAGVPTTYTGGLILYNPLASTVNLALHEVSVGFVIAQTNAAMISLGTAQSGNALTGTLTTVESVNAFVGSTNSPEGVLYSSASITLPVAPAVTRLLRVVETGYGSGIPDEGTTTFDLGEGVILAPGGYAVILSTMIGTANSLMAGFCWEEIPAGQTG